MSLFNEFVQGVGAAVTDIRQKTVEEPYFGRAVTDGPDVQSAASAEPAAPAGPQSAWESQIQQLPTTPEPAQDLPASDHEIDR